MKKEHGEFIVDDRPDLSVFDIFFLNQRKKRTV